MTITFLKPLIVMTGFWNHLQFCVARLGSIPNFSGGSGTDHIISRTHQHPRITDNQSRPDLNTVIDPQPTSKAIPRDNQVAEPYCLQSTGHRLSPDPHASLRTSPNTNSASRDSTAIDNS